MASVPSYNPNKFIPAISRVDFQNYNSNPTNPLLNRSVEARRRRPMAT
jgi:penicillin-binding protein 2